MPPAQPLSNGDPFPENEADTGRSEPPHTEVQSRSTGWWTLRIGAALLALAGVTAGAFFLFRGGSPTAGPSHLPPARTPPPPPRTAFVFPLSATGSVSTGKMNAGAVRAAAAKVQTTLSAFYDAAFLDPATRRQALPASAWNAFARDIQEQARSDAASLTLGETGLNIDTLSLTNATLSVRVL